MNKTYHTLIILFFSYSMYGAMESTNTTKSKFEKKILENKNLQKKQKKTIRDLAECVQESKEAIDRYFYHQARLRAIEYLHQLEIQENKLLLPSQNNH